MTNFNFFNCFKKFALDNGSGMDREWTGNGPAYDLGMTQPRLDSLSLVSRQSVLRTCSAKSSCETFSVGQSSPLAFPFKAKSHLAFSRQSVLAILVACLTLGVGNVWGTTNNGDLFERMTSVDDIVVNAEVMFVYQLETYACGTTQNENNRKPVAITTSNKQYIYNSSNNVQVFVVKKNNSGKFGFHTGSGYIYSASNSNNYLRTNTTSASTNPSGTSAWSLSVSEYNVFSVTNVTNTSYYLAFNKVSYFSQYSSSQSKPYIYKKVMSAPTAVEASDVTTNSATITVTDGTNVNNYELYYSKSSTAPTAGSSATTTITGGKSKTITGLDINSTYYVWARAYSSSPARKTGWKALTGNTFTTLAASCSADPTVGDASLNGSISRITFWSIWGIGKT